MIEHRSHFIIFLLRRYYCYYDYFFLWKKVLRKDLWNTVLLICVTGVSMLMCVVNTLFYGCCVIKRRIDEYCVLVSCFMFGNWLHKAYVIYGRRRLHCCHLRRLTKRVPLVWVFIITFFSSSFLFRHFLTWDRQFLNFLNSGCWKLHYIISLHKKSVGVLWPGRKTAMCLCNVCSLGKPFILSAAELTERSSFGPDCI